MPQVLDQLPVLGLRMVVGGLLVVAFAVIAELSEPKKLAGLFTAAPAVALGGLLVMLATKGAGDVRRAALGMIAGAIAMVVYCGLAAWGVRRLGALAGSVLVLGAWGAVAGLLYWLVG
jgi:uncharacterized membrane protein (GlpM family)